ncbi:MAG: dockerin type I domain-containing protein [Ruminococcus sp.]
MSKTLFKRALSLTAAAFMGIMASLSQMPPVKASAEPVPFSENVCATTPAVTTTLLGRWAFKFDAPKNNISVGEEMTVTLINTYTDSVWDKEELPEFSIGDPEVVSVEKGDETGTFKVRGLCEGSTYVRFIYSGYADFMLTVSDTDVPSVTTTLPTTTDPVNTVSTTTAPGETVTSLQSSPQTTATTAGIELRCDPSYVEIKEGESQYVELYVGSMQYSGDYPEFRVDADDIAGIGPCDYTWGFYVNSIMVGGTYAEITVDYMGKELTAILPIDVLPNNYTTDETGDTGTTMGSSTTATLPTTTAPSNTVTTTTIPTEDTVTSLQSTTEFTTTSTGIEFRCEPNYVQVNVNTPNGLNGFKRVEFYLGSKMISADYVKASVEDESIAGLFIPQEYNSLYIEIEGKAEGSTYAEFTVIYNGEELTAILPIDVLPEEPNLDMTTTLPTSTTTTDPYGNTVTLPSDTTETVPTFTTSIPGSSTTYNSSTSPVTVYTSTATTADTTATVQGIKLSESTVTVSAGQRFGLGVTLYDGSEYGGALVNAVSDNPAVAIAQYSDIPYNFYIVGVSEGTAHFTVYDRIYGSTAELDVTVTAAETGEEFHGLEITIDSLPDKLTYNIGEELDLTGGVFSAVAYESMTDPDSTQHLMIDRAEMTEYNVITGAFDSTKPGTYPIIISKNHNIYGGWDVEVFYVTVSVTGDINSDSTVDISDASNVLSIYAMAAAGMEIASENAAAADINGDGKADLTDAGLILTYYAKTAAGISCTWDDIIS